MTRSTGISLADYDAMRKRQNGACAICKRSGQALCVDHCHACGKVRGLLCGKCNSVLGFCDDSPAHLLAAAAYLRASCDQAPASSMTSVASVETGQSRAHGVIVAAQAKPYESSVADLTFLSALPHIIGTSNPKPH